MREESINQKLIKAAKKDNVTAIRNILNEGYDPNGMFNNLLQILAIENAVQCLEFVLPQIPKNSDNASFALTFAAANGRMESMKMLLPFSKKDKIEEALLEAARETKKDCADVLMEHCQAPSVVATLDQRGLHSAARWLEELHQAYIATMQAEALLTKHKDTNPQKNTKAL